MTIDGAQTSDCEPSLALFCFHHHNLTNGIIQSQVLCVSHPFMLQHKSHMLFIYTHYSAFVSCLVIYLFFLFIFFLFSSINHIL